MSRDVLVVGGGLAGVTAALRCADDGLDVTLLESRARLGGAAGSFQRGELAVDTGQHVILRCYTAYRALLRRIGAADGVRIQPRLRIPVLGPGGRRSVLLRRRLPAPAHLAPALLGYGELGPGERLRAARTAIALRALDPADPALDEISFGAWLRSRGETGRAVDALWGLLSVAALNAPPDRASLALAVKVFRTGLLDTPDAADIGIPRRPLGELHGTVAHRALEAAGVRVLLRTKAVVLRQDELGWRVPVRGRGGQDVLNADSVVLAVPHSHATALLAEQPLPAARRWGGLSAAPIVNVHVRYDRPVLAEPMAAVLDSPVQWLFDRTSIAGARHGQYLAISLSAAHEHLDRRTDELRAVFLPALQEVLPRARRARVEDFFVTREPRATFAQAPGTGALRPAAGCGPTGLALAGAWTATGWPDTLEGAVRSGELAAHVVRAAVGQARRAGVEVPR
ncbi:hydroxysqualene dehydroxylase HpnE [Saccharopolyspora gloriosae]|uniref:Squalene-associated FAD-dependent desaturase n=1 Tax=Saccharopolyspora gloriosae TaxID=455344 RepID=A0A840NB14_9PSEU|nr:squalene-associated FAD-dependent desaturase [Saccharopolyspora gloriosae]